MDANLREDPGVPMLTNTMDKIGHAATFGALLHKARRGCLLPRHRAAQRRPGRQHVERHPRVRAAGVTTGPSPAVRGMGGVGRSPHSARRFRPPRAPRGRERRGPVRNTQKERAVLIFPSGELKKKGQGRQIIFPCPFSLQLSKGEDAKQVASRVPSGASLAS